MKNKFHSFLQKAKQKYCAIRPFLLCVFFWQLFVTLFWFTTCNLLLLFVVGFVVLTNLFLLL
jgi:hypothetical protein